MNHGFYLKKKSFSLLIVLTVFLYFTQLNIGAAEIDEGPENILHPFLNELSQTKSTYQKDEIRDKAVKALNDYGYTAFALDSENHESIEKTLSTQLDKLGISEKDHCIIYLSNNSTSRTRRSYSSDSFNYSYGGNNYKLRYLTVTASDNPSYNKSSSEGLLDTKTREIIRSFLNSTLTTFVGTQSQVIGTISSIIGLTTDNFSTAGNSTSHLYAASTWTRKFTQVYNTKYQSWYSGSCVEYVERLWFIGGTYIDSRTNRSHRIPEITNTDTVYSPNFSNASWKCNHAVAGFLNSYTFYDLTGSCIYKVDGYGSITHTEKFY